MAIPPRPSVTAMDGVSLPIDDELDLFQNGISDYPLNIVVPGEVKEIQLMKMETSQKEILGYLKDSSSLERLQRRIRMDGFRYSDIEADVFELINQVTGSRLVLEPFKTAEGGVDMCEAIDQMRRKIERGEEFERMYHAASKKCDELNKKYSDASRIVRKLEDRLRASGISEEEIKALKD